MCTHASYVECYSKTFAAVEYTVVYALRVIEMDSDDCVMLKVYDVV